MMMGHNDDLFSSEGIDEQIEQHRPTGSPPTPGDQLIQDLQTLARSEQQVDQRSLEYVWQQVQARREHATASDQRNKYRFQALRKQPERKRSERKGKEAMEITTLAQAKKRGSMVRIVGISLVAAVAVITILSFAFFSGVLRPASPAADKGSSTLTGAPQQQYVISHGTLVCSFTTRETVPMNGVAVPWYPDLSWSTQGQIGVGNYADLNVYSAKNCSPAFAQSSLQRNSGVLWSPDGKMLAVSDTGTDTTSVLDTYGKIITHISPANGARIWSLDSKELIFTSGGSIKSVNVGTGDRITTLMQIPVHATALLFSPDHRLVLMVLVNKGQKSFEIWDLKSGKKIHTLASQGNRDSFFGWAFSPDGTQIATDAPLDSKIQIFSTANGKLLTTFENKVVSRRGVDTLVWSPDGKYIADSADVIKVYAVTAKKIAATFGKVADQDWITTLTWAPDSTGLASVTTRNMLVNSVPSDNTVSIWQLR